MDRERIHVISNAPSTVEAGKGNLSNTDFRKLLQTGALKGRSQHDDEEDEFDQRRRRRHKPSAKQNKWQAKKQERQEASLYRDRAKERREDSNPDYNDTQTYADVDTEHSKYLGGDVKHTHLVRGLDRALLQKKKVEFERIDEEKLEKEFVEAQQRKKKQKKVSRPDTIRFMTPMGKNVYGLIMGIHQPTQPVQQFLPGRMTYDFDLHPDFASSNLPTTLMQSRSDCPADDLKISGAIRPDIQKRIGKIMSFIHQGNRYVKGSGKDRRNKKKKKHTRDDDDVTETDDKESINNRSKVKPPLSFNAEDDIFGGVGSNYTYEPHQDSDAKQDDYFDSTKAEREKEQKLVELRQQMEAQEAVAKEQKRQKKELEQRKKAQEQAHKGNSFGIPSGADDCYPDAMGLGLDDSDEEDLDKMDTGTKDRTRPWDFDNQEDWDKYNATKEANPKAAFQFGQKMSDGRKSHSARLKAGRRSEEAMARSAEQKFNRDFQKITEIMKRKDRKAGKAPSDGQATKQVREAKRAKILMRR